MIKNSIFALLQAKMHPIFTAAVLSLINYGAEGDQNMMRLYKHLMRNYQKRARPVQKSSDSLTVHLGLKLSQLIGIEEKNQIMTTNVWLSQAWEDHYLRWNHSDYGGIKELQIPATDIWTPDIVLYNNADGHFQVTIKTKASIRFDGQVMWEPPAIYKSSCAIDVEFFPFDEQTCSMKFSSWTYDMGQVDLKHKNQADIDGDVEITYAVDMTEYSASYIWDIMAVMARRSEVKYECCPEKFPDVTFYITMRRKTLFYTVNLIIPCIGISFLTVFVFCLPSDSGEKISLCISILLSLTVFFLLLSELIPPTSFVIPLMGKYLLFTMTLVTLSVVITVININIHNRTTNTHSMPGWVRSLFLKHLPSLLLMKRPEASESHAKLKTNSDYSFKAEDFTNSAAASVQSKQLTTRADRAVNFITDQIFAEDIQNQVKEDWKYLAMVIDRSFLFLFTFVCVVGTLTIFLQADTVFDGRKVINYNAGF